MTFIFLVAYDFLFAVYSNLTYLTLIFYLSSFFFIVPVGGLCCKPKYWANLIHHFIFLFFLYFFYHSSCRKDHFTVLNLTFGTQDFTDPGLLKIQRTLNGLSLWFCIIELFYIGMPVVLTDGRPIGQTYGHVISKISRIDRLPHFIRYGVTLSRVSRARSFLISWFPLWNPLPIIFLHYLFIGN